jgi:Na+/H+-translocating membrane pyrophosphatase
MKADVLAGLFVGGMIPFIFSSLAIAAVGRRNGDGAGSLDVSLEKFRELWSIKRDRNTRNASLFLLKHLSER